MSSTTTVPRFMGLPLEIRQNIWQDAASTGPMRLDLTEYEDADPDAGLHTMFFLSTEGRNHVAEHQRQRFAIYMASKESRHECLRQSELVLTSSMLLYLTGFACKRAENGEVDQKGSFRSLLINWRSDLLVMDLVWHLGSVTRDSFCPRFPWASITRLGFRQNFFVRFHDLRGTKEIHRRNVKDWLECWSSVQEITCVLDQQVKVYGYSAPRSAPQLDWCAPLEDTYHTSNAFAKELNPLGEVILGALSTANFFRQWMDKLGRKVKVETVLELPWPGCTVEWRVNPALYMP